MILCLFGTNPYDFSRLAKALDRIAKSSDLTFIIQIGNTGFTPKYCNYFKFKSIEEIYNLIDSSELIICQGGFGSMTDALKGRKKVIAVPRLSKFGECLDDQVELVQYFESKKFLKACYDLDNLNLLISDVLSEKISFTPFYTESKILVSDILINYFNSKNINHI